MLRLVVNLCHAIVLSRARLLAENMALRHQLGVLSRGRKRPKLQKRDRVLWVFLSRMFGGWRSWLFLVKPDTVVGWHRTGFRLFWRWKSRRRSLGRPTITPEIAKLIRRLAEENRIWGAPRIHGELKKLGFEVSERSVGRYLQRIRREKPSGQTWMTFLRNHMNVTASCDFFVVPTVTFRLLYCFVIMTHARRNIVHFNVSSNPTAQWAAHQMIEAFPGDGTEPRYLICDNDGIFGGEFVGRVDRMGIDQKPISPRSPWQNPFCERVIGTVRRECTDHVIVFGERHLMRLLREYLGYYHNARTHLSLNKDAPESRGDAAGTGCVSSSPVLGGLHHTYRRAA